MVNLVERLQEIVSGPITYKPWTNGHAIGFECVHQSGAVSYIYLNPSTNPDPEQQDVFLYHGAAGDPAQDAAVVYVDPCEGSACLPMTARAEEEALSLFPS